MTEIVINHLTRMRAPRICIAGLDPVSKKHIRPVTGPEGYVGRSLLRREGGVCDIGVKVELGELATRSVPPEVEDHVFDPGRACATATLSPDAYLSLIDDVCVEDLAEAFGPELEQTRWKLSLKEGVGKASLACLRVGADPYTELSTNRYGKLTLRLSGPDRPCFLPVNDLRLYREDQETVIRAAVEDVQTRLAQRVPLRLMVGLTRPWEHDGSRRHWLQVNGLCLEDSPLGDTP